ncbi:MAG: thioredoxin family protein [Saprospiraceae bacterium]
MPRIALPFFLLIATIHAAAARPAPALALGGAIANIPLNGPRRLALEAWVMDQWQQVQIIPVDADNAFSATLDAVHPGQFRLRVFGQAKIWCDFVVADSAMADNTLRFKLDYRDMNGQAARLPESPVNTLYAALTDARDRLNQLRDSSATMAQADEALTALNRLCLETAARYPRTLIADIALLLFQPAAADYISSPEVKKMTANEFARAYDLDKIPFHHDNILYHNAFLKALNRYYNYFSRDDAGSQAYIEGIMSRRNGSDAVDGFLFRFLLDRMMDAKQEGGLNYLLNWYTPDCSDENPLPDYTRNLLVALKVCAPGNTVPDLALPGMDEKNVALSQICPRYNITLLLFWRSTCSHCREFEPELARIYAKYHPLGVEVFALSNDKSKEDWQAFLQQNPSPWINVFIPQEQRAEIARQFPAPSTPTLIAVDSRRRVVSRLISRSALESFLDSALQKQQEHKGR